ncbi:dynein heavy chain 17, axonemal-like [Myzus persicae]|uniref:dynein heavy chain 17, axonemal-like n=1 Tax=Myzus persicae TaxID=13164 RepID=UPI000B938B0A|nr:dynein heavy chain 17, axonemal-like [Myzus persicae]
MIIKFIDYQKLEKVEVGGLMGCWYGPMVENMYLRFNKYMEKMVSIAYDPLDLLSDVNNALFMEDYNFYLNMSDDIDNRLATVSKACFENIDDSISFHKFIMVFGSAVLNRPMVAAAVEKHYEKVLDLLDQDLAQELKIIDRLSGTGMVTEIEKSDYYETRFIPEEMDLEYPLVARAIMWGNSRLNNRLLEDLNVIRSFDLPIMKTPRGDQINIKAEQLKDKFKNYLSPIIEEWKRVVPLQIQDKIVQPLFTINKNNIISLNFSEELDAAIKVTRYIILCNYNFKNPILTIETNDIPYEAIKLYKREKLILEYKRDIEEIVKWYNMLRTETHPTELQLIIQEIENIENLIDDAQKNVTWNTEDIVYSSENDLHEETYTESEQFMSPISLQNTISTIHSLTKNVYERVIQTHENFQKIIALSSQWINKPMYVRDKNTKRITFDNKLTEKKIARYAEVRDASIEIQQLLMEDLLLFHNVPLLDPNLGKLTSSHSSLIC